MVFLKQRKGISLIVLIITIIVIIILAGAIILNLTKNNPMESAKKAKFMSNIDQYESELMIWENGEMSKTNGEFDPKSLNADKDSGNYKNITMPEIITSMRDDDLDDFEIQDGRLVFVNTDKEQEYEWAEEIGKTPDTNNGGTTEPPAEKVESTSSLWEFNPTTQTITKYLGSDVTTITTITIPNYIDGIPVKSVSGSSGSIFQSEVVLNEIKISGNIQEIGNRAFIGIRSLTTVKIPSSIKRIGDQAFYSTGITEISVPNDIEYIGKMAFLGCSDMKSLKVIDKTKKVTGFKDGSVIDENAFTSCTSLTDVTIPDGVTEILNMAFSSNTSLNNLNISESVIHIAYQAFYGCEKLVTVELPSNIEKIGQNAFFMCNKIESIKPSNYPLSDVYKKYEGEFEYLAVSGLYNLKSIKVPEKITKLGDNSISNNYALESLELPQSLKYIERSAFYGSGLSSITIPKNVISIGNSVFGSSPNLKTINLEEGITEIGDNWFYAYDSIQTINIPNTVTRIGKNAFFAMNGLKNVIIPDSVTTIDEGGFIYCSGIENISLSKNLKTIGNSAFYGSRMSSIDLPNTLTSIGDTAFAGSSNLTQITIPSSVTSIGEGAFNYCDALTSITVNKVINSISGAPWGAPSVTVTWTN